METKNILLVEDNPVYLEVALKVIASENLLIARNYEEARQKLGSASSLITDLFFRENSAGSTSEIGEKAIESIRTGFAKKYIDRMSSKIREAGLEIDPTLERCLYVLGQNYGVKGTESDNAILTFLEIYGSEGPRRLEQMISNHTVIEGSWEKSLARKTQEHLAPLRTYMQESPDNFPLGYLVCEEAERLGKQAVLATSLRHSNQAAAPIVASAHQRGWKMLEGGDGNKDGPEYWIKAYSLLKGGEENDRKNN